jgi:exonuclease III
VDIAALSETRFLGEDSLEEKGEGYTFFWRGLPEGSHRLHGVGFTVRTTLLRHFPESPEGVSERLMRWRIPLSKGKYATLISIYAPTLVSGEHVKDAFYETLDALLLAIPQTDQINLLGDFNARVGSGANWGGVLGGHGVG